jgi:hypothetical protein
LAHFNLCDQFDSWDMLKDKVPSNNHYTENDLKKKTKDLASSVSSAGLRGQLITCSLDVKRVCEPKKIISSIFFKCDEYKHNINGSTLN